MKTIAILAVLGLASMTTGGSGSLGAADALASEYQVDETKITTPEEALQALKDGNKRFVNNEPLNQDFQRQIAETANGQKPYAGILSCLDSRVPPEIVFDQGFGDVFVGRVAGNIEDINMLGSFEFATELVGTKLLVVLGHTSCGAVKGACQNAKLGNLTHLLDEIRPAVETIKAKHPDKDVCSPEMIDLVVEQNVIDTIEDIRSKSQVITELEAAGKVMVVGAMYDISTGKVRFLEPTS
jgi:carbonic anhydrase